MPDPLCRSALGPRGQKQKQMPQRNAVPVDRNQNQQSDGAQGDRKQKEQRDGVHRDCKQKQQSDGVQSGHKQQLKLNDTMVLRSRFKKDTSSSISPKPLAPSSTPSSSSHGPSQSAPAKMDTHSEAINSCAFCQILRGELPATVIKEWDDIICLIPLDSCTPGHVLVIPKQHVKDGAEDAAVTAGTIRCAMEDPRELMRKAAQHLKEPLPSAIDFDFNTQFSTGINATQTVFHLHVHLVPRFAGDGLPIMWTGQEKGHYNTTGRPKIKIPTCKAMPDEKKCSLCKRRHMMTKEQQIKARRR